MPVASYLASSRGRLGRVVSGSMLALTGVMITGLLGQVVSVWTVLVVMLGAEIAVGGILNVCILCPLAGLPFQGRRLR